MRALKAAVAEDWRGVLFGLLGVVAVTALLVTMASSAVSLPVALLLLPVMATALVAGGPATGAVAIASLGVATWIYVDRGQTGAEAQLRFTAVVLGCGLAVALGWVRRRREERIASQEARLALVREGERAEQLLLDMLVRLQDLAGASDVHDVARRSCRIARDVFGADVASYWQVEGDDAVLVAREPGELPIPMVRLPAEQLSGESHWAGRSRTTWVEVESLDVDDPRRVNMQRAGARTGCATPIRVDFTTVAYLALSWPDDRPAPDRAWMQTLDRFADQVALAKTVVRRRLAQQETRDLTDRLQASFLPGRVEDVPNADVRLLYRPGMRQLLLGGDFLDVAPIAGGGTAFLIGDVSGHGPEQAALAMTLRAAWRGATSVCGATLQDRMAALDVVVNERRPSEGLFVTVVTGELDRAMTTMRYLSAGHPPPILMPGAEVAPLGGPPLGVLGPGSTGEAVTVPVPPRTAVLLVTDGLFEGRTSPGGSERMGFDDFVDLLAKRPSVEDHGYLDTLADELEALNGAPLPDDAAALLLLPRALA